MNKSDCRIFSLTLDSRLQQESLNEQIAFALNLFSQFRVSHR
jgi:hypothetical protein